MQTYKFKTKDSGINAFQLFLYNFFKEFSAYNVKKTGSCRYVYDFSVDNYGTGVAEILGIPKYLMTKNNRNKCSSLLNKYLLHYISLVDFY